MRDGYIICVYGGDLCKVPFEDQSGEYYPEYAKAEIIKKNCGLTFTYTGKDGEMHETYYGLLVEEPEDYCYRLVEETWDGFQYIYNWNLDEKTALNIIVQILECYRLAINKRKG